MKIRSRHHNSQGFTLVELLAVIAIAGIVLALGVPSLLQMRKPLREGVTQFNAQLNLIRTKAISSNQAFRLRPKYATRAEYLAANPSSGYNNIPRSFIVEFTSNCQVPDGATGTNRWRPASQGALDIDLPQEVGITDAASTSFGTSSGTVSIDNALNWNICFDNRGILSSTSRRQLVFKDFRANSRAGIAIFNISAVGGIDIFTYQQQPSNSYPLGTALVDQSGSPMY